MASHTDFEKWITVLKTSSWLEARAILERKATGNWIFRGQGSSRWVLETSFDRIVHTKRHPKDFESYIRANFARKLFDQFTRKAPYLLEPTLIPHSTTGGHEQLNWWAIMQHYGAPTLLLDWTRSPYIASFFAVEDATAECSVWCLDPEWAAEMALTLAKQEMDVSGLRVTSFSDEAYLDLAMSGQATGVFPVEPSRTNQRQVFQQGLFLTTGNTSSSFMNNLLAYGRKLSPESLKKHVLRVDIPCSACSQALRQLQSMNVSRATLFPGLEGLSRSLKHFLQLLVDEESGEA